MIDRAMLIGTWQMLFWTKEFSDTGEIVDVLGPDPVGFISYGADGRMQVIVVRRDRQPPRSTPPSPDEKLALFDSMFAYAGTYSVHDDQVVHHVDASWNQTWTGSDQVRFFKLNGATLEITAAPIPDPYTGRTVVGRVVFRKWQA
jgi:hypothetical protein